MMEMLVLSTTVMIFPDVTMNLLVVQEFVKLDIATRCKDGSHLLWIVMITMLALLTGAIPILENVNILISPVMTMILALMTTVVV
jgi:hypothetical protein